MTLSREEIAVRLACADVQGSSLPPDKDRAVWAAQVVATTDAIGAALTLTPAPVAPPAGPCPGEDARDDAEARKRIAAYVPKAGDVVTLTTDKAACVVRVALNADEYAMVYGDHNTGTFRFDTFGRGKYVYLRDATDAEKRAAGLAVPPQATATCPGCGSENRSVRGWIRVRRVDDLNSDALLASEDFPVSHRTIRTVRCTARFHTSPPATTPVPEVLTPDVPEGSTIAQLAAEQRASMGLTASMGSTQHFTHAATPAPEVCCASPLCPHSSPGGGTSQVGGAAERDAGIVTPASPTPAPEAKRPEWVRSVGATTDAQKAAPRRVLRWEGERASVGYASKAGVVDEGCPITLRPGEWEPCDPPAPCPPPVAGRGEKDEAVRGLVAFAARVSDTLRLDGTKRNADLVTEAGRLVALAREAGLCEGGSK